MPWRSSESIVSVVEIPQDAVPLPISSNSTSHNIASVAWNQPWLKYLHHGNWQTLQIRVCMAFLQRAGCETCTSTPLDSREESIKKSLWAQCLVHTKCSIKVRLDEDWVGMMATMMSCSPCSKPKTSIQPRPLSWALDPPGPSFPDTSTRLPKSALDLTPPEQNLPSGTPQLSEGQGIISLAFSLPPSRWTNPSPLLLTCTGVTCQSHSFHTTPLPTGSVTIPKHKSNHSLPLPGSWFTQKKVQAPCHHPRFAPLPSLPLLSTGSQPHLPLHPSGVFCYQQCQTACIDWVHSSRWCSEYWGHENEQDKLPVLPKLPFWQAKKKLKIISV